MHRAKGKGARGVFEKRGRIESGINPKEVINLAEVNVSNTEKRDVQMSCEDFRFILVAGPYRKDLPPAVRELMDEHARTCTCFESPGSHQDAISIPVTPAMEEAAKKIIDQYNR